MRGIVITGGEAPGPVALREIAKGTDLLAAADSGLVAAEEAGLNPDWVIGDMDSLGNMVSLDDLSRLGKYPPDRVIRYPTDKDFTDTELAIALLREKGCDEIWLAGGGGGRTDHLFAIFSLFESDHSGVVRPDRWFTANEEIRCLREGRALDATLPPGNLVSVFPLGLGPWEAESSGLKWPLDGLAWERGGLGLSNVAAAGVFKIRSVQGRFMVMWALPYI